MAGCLAKAESEGYTTSVLKEMGMSIGVKNGGRLRITEIEPQYGVTVYSCKGSRKVSHKVCRRLAMVCAGSPPTNEYIISPSR